MLTIKGLHIIPTDLLEQYKATISDNLLSTAFERLEDAELSTAEFSFYTSVASVYSSKIEGEPIELDSYIKHKRFNIEFQPDYTRKIDDLYLAYQFASENKPEKETFAKTHTILAKHIVSTNWLGKFRNQNMFVTTKDGRIEYVAATPFEVPSEMEKLYADLQILLDIKLTISEIFFFASMLHLVFVKIHPWNDGNGRCARLLEKWFLAQKLGNKAWFVQSEKYYYTQHETYYSNIRALGLEYPDLNYKKALPFLLMLPKSVTEKI
ncbi:Fic family protein [Pedobacter hartonius]|uniref:Fic/DOC family protein n=1 Tax=Pedobacter hartonius TaxID=425514 RepID=A0A1H4CYQ9_9SPHI|nr:Fic family protein [Pedobacter hartonius]SEA65527.1 Fic/DOC family protein [Pedobacter hartonius]